MITEIELPHINRFPGDITTGPDGNLWFAEADGRLGQLIVETGRTPNERLVMQVYRDLLGREAEAVGLSFWTGLMSQGFTRFQIVLGIEASPEYHGLVVQRLYGQLLGRTPEPAGQANWVGFLAQGGTTEQAEALIAASPEYFQCHGANNDGFVTALYQDMLLRNPDPAETQAWSQLLARGWRNVVASAFLASPASNGLEVQGWYAQFLRRQADPEGLAFFTDLQQRGVSREQEVAFIVGSDEYFARLM